MPDVSHRRARDINGVHGVQKVAFHQHDVRRLDGNICPRADGKSHIGASEGGRVVDAVADHGNGAAFGAKARDTLLLVLRQDLGEDAINADTARDGGCRLAVVARQEHDLHPARAERGDGGGTCGLDAVGKRDDAEQRAVGGEVERCCAARCELCSFVGKGGAVHAMGCHEPFVPAEHTNAAEDRRDTAARHCRKAGRRLRKGKS